MNWLQHLKTLLHRYEPLLFWSCAVAFIAPLWLAAGIYTYDGPAHLYNARQLWELIFENNAWLSSYYVLNTGPDNWLVHGMLMLLQAAFGAVLAEKIWLTLYVFIFILGFRLWMLHMQQNTLSWWVFLLPYFFNLLMGQYSFALSVALVPFFMLYWQRFLVARNRSYLLLAAVFLLLLYLTHVVSFGMAGLAAGLLVIWQVEGRRDKIRTMVQLACIALPGLVLTLLFMIRNADSAANQWLPLAERLQFILDFRALIGYSYSEDVSWTRLVAALFALLILVGVWQNRHQERKAWVWLVIWGSLLLLNLAAPDLSAGGGFIQTRLNILFIVYSVALLASFNRMKRWYMLSLPLVLFLTLRLGVIHYINNRNLAAYRADWETVAHLIPEKSTVVTFNFSPLWFQHHIQLLIGQDKAIVHSSNYEADNNYFPLRWQSRPEIQDWLIYWAANKSLSPCGPEGEPAEKYLPDYIICYFHENGKEQTFTQSLDALLVSHYASQPVFSSAHLQVYQRR